VQSRKKEQWNKDLRANRFLKKFKIQEFEKLKNNESKLYPVYILTLQYVPTKFTSSSRLFNY